MSANAIFNVLTEFRFDIAHAVAGSKTLQTEVGKISAAADQAHFALQRVGMGIIAQTGLGTGGLAGALYAAVKAADKFEASQRSIANIMLSNNLFTGPEAFTQAMNEAAAAMEDMRKAANEFSLPADDLMNFTKLVGATLVSHGLDTSRFEKSLKISRGFLKSAPTLGIDPGLAQGQLLDAVMGRANMGDTLYQRLTNETAPMKAFAGTAGAKAFNALEPAKRVAILSDALIQFGSNTKIVTENALSLSSQMQRLRDNIVGTFSVLRGIGKVFLDPIKKVLLQVNRYLETNGRKLADSVGKIFGDIFKDPEKLFVWVQQLRRLQGDVKRAGSLLTLIGLIHGITAALQFFGITLKGGLIATIIRGIGSAFSWVGGLLVSTGALTFIMRALMFMVTKVLAPLVLFTTILQGISRGLAAAKIADAKWIMANMDKFMAFFEQMKIHLVAIFAPFELAINGIGMFVEWVFSFGALSDYLVGKLGIVSGAFEIIGRTVVGLLSILAGFFSAIGGMIGSLQIGNFKEAFSNIGENFMSGMTDFYRQYYAPKSLDMSQQATAQTKVEINKIEINNAFKENAEPDRIAFTLKDQLMKAALNPTQSAGRSLGASAIGR